MVWWDPWSGSAREMRMYRVIEFWGSINKTPFNSWPKSIYEPLMCSVVVAGVTEVGTDPRFT